MKKFFLIAFFVFAIPQNIALAVELDFGAIEFVPGGGNLNATMDPTSGNISCNNAANYTCTAFGTPGTTLIAGQRRSVVDITCRSTARISNGAFTFDIARSEISVDGNPKVRCRGLNNVVETHTIKRNSSRNIVSWAGRLKVRNVGSNDFSGIYTSNGGGNARPQTIRIIFL